MGLEDVENALELAVLFGFNGDDYFFNALFFNNLIDNGILAKMPQVALHQKAHIVVHAYKSHKLKSGRFSLSLQLIVKLYGLFIRSHHEGWEADDAIFNPIGRYAGNNGAHYNGKTHMQREIHQNGGIIVSVIFYKVIEN